MLCSLCERDADQLIRVNGWQVCQWCVSNNVLNHAIEVRTNVARLTAAVAIARIKDRQDSVLVTEARDKLQAMHEELEMATKNLAILSEQSQKSLAKSLGVVEALEQYKELEAAKTRKARTDKP